MKLLCVVSTLNFKNFTRRATIEAIWRQNPETDLLMFTGLKTYGQKSDSIPGLKTYHYRVWTPEKLKTIPLGSSVEHVIRKKQWAALINQYESIFLTDPNQYWLLPYIGDQKLIYLIRDPNVLQSRRNHPKEKVILQRADTILATSRNLAERYLPEYYGFQHPNIHYWPNTVDLNIWDADRYLKINFKKGKFTAGMAGNMNDRTDLELLDFITDLEKVDFEFCGKIFDSVEDKKWLNKILAKKNVTHLGYIPFDKLPQTVAGWHCGLTIEKKCEYTRFTHHNKIYQYLALGLPVVTLKIHDDYSHLEPYVQSAENYSEYISELEAALENSRDPQFQKACIAKAKENSADKRAEDFLRWLKDLMNE